MILNRKQIDRRREFVRDVVQRELDAVVLPDGTAEALAKMITQRVLNAVARFDRYVKRGSV